MHRPMAYVDSNITTFVYFPDYLSAYYKIATFRNPLKGVDVASEDYFPLGLPNYENKPIDGIQTVIGRYHILMENLELARKIANMTKAVLITGETGTGKDLLARYIHLVGTRRRGPFHIVNCSAINPALFDRNFLVTGRILIPVLMKIWMVIY